MRSFLNVFFTLTVGVSMFFLGGECVAMFYAGLIGQPFIIKDQEAELLQKASWTLLLLGPVAYKLRNYVDP
jgi:hypothetical protein